VAIGTAEEIVETLRTVLTWAPSAAPLGREDRLADLRRLADTPARGIQGAFQSRSMPLRFSNATLKHTQARPENR